MVVELAIRSLSLTRLFTDNVGVHFALTREHLPPRVLYAEVILASAGGDHLHCSPDVEDPHRHIVQHLLHARTVRLVVDAAISTELWRE